jgi:hypothetical protein
MRRTTQPRRRKSLSLRASAERRKRCCAPSIQRRAEWLARRNRRWRCRARPAGETRPPEGVHRRFLGESRHFHASSGIGLWS